VPGPTHKATVIPDPKGTRDLHGLEHLAWLMDRALKIPGTNIAVGLDALLGLLPVGGDFLTGLVQTGIVVVALYRYRVPRAVAARMAANVLIDVALGALPLVGDAFDIGFKANTRNIRLLQQVQAERSLHREPKSWPSVLLLSLLALAMVSLLALVLIGFIAVVAWLFRGHPAA
jgi:hypothetical protein